MKVIIHDLGSEYESLFEGKSDRIVSADGRYAPCQGCFGCWTKTPAECYMKDSLHEVCRVVGTADELVIITDNCYGSYSPAVKNILDRSIGLSTPFSTYRARQMHHTLRYGMHKALNVYVYGDTTDSERSTFELLAERNAINFGFKESSVVFAESPEKLEGLL